MKKQCLVCRSTSIMFAKFNDYCLEHLPDSKRCTAITKSGYRCKVPSMPTLYHCKIHKRTMRKSRQGYKDTERLPGGRGPGFIYIMDLGRDNYYKIGQTRNGNQRLSAMQSSNPWAKLIFCHPVYNASHVEKNLHYIFKNQNIQREIFSLTEDDIEKAREYVKEHYYETRNDIECL